MACVIIMHQNGKNWASVFGLFKDELSAKDYLKHCKEPNFSYFIDAATDEEITKALDIHSNNNKAFVNPEFLGIRKLN